MFNANLTTLNLFLHRQEFDVSVLNFCCCCCCRRTWLQNYYHSISLVVFLSLQGSTAQWQNSAAISPDWMPQSRLRILRSWWTKLLVSISHFSMIYSSSSQQKNVSWCGSSGVLASTEIRIRKPDDLQLIWFWPSVSEHVVLSPLQISEYPLGCSPMIHARVTEIST